MTSPTWRGADDVSGIRHLVVVLGDQLDPESAALDGFDSRRDRLWMAEVDQESTRVWSHKARIALFLSAMRHFRDAQRALGREVVYRELEQHPFATLAQALADDIETLQPQRIVMVEAGEWSLRQALRDSVEACGLELDERRDRHFLCGQDAFERWAGGRKAPRMEHFYRWLRRREGVLMDGAAPAGGRWNFDAENRAGFDRRGPGMLPHPIHFTPDALTREVLDLVQRRYGGHPGSLAEFDWPVTPEQANAALADFIHHRLPLFGRYQDAMWRDEPWLYHARLAGAMNLKLLNPRRVIAAAETAWREDAAPLNAVEGFIRQVLGWREFVRGIYWLKMPGYLDDNALDAHLPLPAFYWNADTEMACMRDAIGQTLRHGYAHHIQRLMVTGLYALLLGVQPREVHAWYLAIYVDAVEWVELPNVLGMSQYADGGFLASKPYVASGRYIQRMSNHCDGCRFRPDQAVGADACPFTTLYWDFLDRHRERFAAHPRTALMWRNLDRIDPERMAAIRERALALREP